MTWEELDDLAQSLGWDSYRDAEQHLADKFGYSHITALDDAVFCDGELSEDDVIEALTPEELEIWNAAT